MNKSLEEEWERFFLDKHLDDVVNTGYFTGYSFQREVDSEEIEEVTFVSEYYCQSLEQLYLYNKNAAADLKKEVMDLFDGKFRAKREVLEVIDNSN